MRILLFLLSLSAHADDAPLIVGNTNEAAGGTTTSSANAALNAQGNNVQGAIPIGTAAQPLNTGGIPSSLPQAGFSGANLNGGGAPSTVPQGFGKGGGGASSVPRGFGAH